MCVRHFTSPRVPTTGWRHGYSLATLSQILSLVQTPWIKYFWTSISVPFLENGGLPWFECEQKFECFSVLSLQKGLLGVRRVDGIFFLCLSTPCSLGGRLTPDTIVYSASRPPARIMPGNVISCKGHPSVYSSHLVELNVSHDVNKTKRCQHGTFSTYTAVKLDAVLSKRKHSFRTIRI